MPRIKLKNLTITTVLTAAIGYGGYQVHATLNAWLPDAFGEIFQSTFGITREDECSPVAAPATGDVCREGNTTDNLYGLLLLLTSLLSGSALYATGRRVKTHGRVELADYFTERQFSKLQVNRRGYSDRLAYTLAELADLAYYDVYTREELGSLQKLSTSTNPVQADLGIVAVANTLLYKRKYIMKDEFDEVLQRGGFESIRHFIQSGSADIHNPNTQCFVARHRNPETNAPDYLVVAFRGSETDIDDWLTNADATPSSEMLENGYGKVHQGFYTAYRSVQREVLTAIAEVHQDDPGLPVYFTGHSLGGALALVATRLNAVDTSGACYTFGAPRTGGYDFFKGMKTPVYRIVNASDLVPRVPPGVWGNAVIVLLNVLAFLTASLKPVRQLLLWAREFVDKINDYRHYGDLRFLPDVASANIEDAAEKDRKLQVLTNPNQFDMVQWFFRHLLVSFGMPVKSHSMKLYRNKLLRVARTRLQRLDRDEPQIGA